MQFGGGQYSSFSLLSFTHIPLLQLPFDVNAMFKKTLVHVDASLPLPSRNGHQHEDDEDEKRPASSHSSSHMGNDPFRPQPPALPIQQLPYPIVTHMPLMRSPVAGIDVRAGGPDSSHNPLIAGATGMPFPFIGPTGAPFLPPGQPLPPVSAGQHPGPGYHVSGPNGQQQMFPPFIPYPYFLVPQAYSQMASHDQQRPQLVEESPIQMFGDRDMIPNRTGSNHSHSSGGMRRRNRNQRKQSASTAESSSPPHTQQLPHSHPHHSNPHHPQHAHTNQHHSNQRQPVTPSHIPGTESRQTRSSSSSSSHVVLAASPPTSLSSCPCFSDEETAATKKQPEQSADSQPASPVAVAPEDKVIPKKANSPSVTVRQVNGNLPAAATTVTCKPPSGPKSWSSLFKSAQSVATVAPAAGIHTQSHQMFDRVCLGGTFDSIHDGHEKLLNESLAKCTEMLTIGVTDESMIRKKVLWELIQPVGERIEAVRRYCESYLTEKGRPALRLNIVPISDPFGPAITDATLKAIVVSDETISGATKINQMRQSSGMPLLHVVSIRLVSADHKECSLEEDKVSSSTLRMRRLGTLLKEPANNNLARRPYLIGLTGGIASGKTSISNEFKKLGAGIIDCDKLAHLTYKPGSPVYDKIIREFGQDVVDVRTREILRNKLGAKIFGNASAKAKLESMVWPETTKLVFQEAERLRVQEKKEVVIVEAAQIIEAKWTDRLHQVWVTMIPEDVAVKRVMERNSLTENEAKQRINSQMTNKERVSHANVVFSTLWDREFTRAQVQRAWNMLHKRFLRAV